MSSFLCRLRFIDLHRQVIDEINGGSYDLDFALDMDSRVNGVISEIKDYFQVATDSRKQFSRSNEMTSFERTICQMMAQERLLQLHRPFLFQSYHDSRYVSNDGYFANPVLIILYPRHKLVINVSELRS